MSGEFGCYCSGYFHTQMEYAAADLKCGRDALSREWAAFFEEFQHVARAISWSEACDSGEDYPIAETIRRIDALKDALFRVEKYVTPFKRVAEVAVREAVRAQKMAAES